MQLAESVKLALSVAGFFAGLVTLSLVYLQMRKTHDWNRRKASQDLLFQLVTGDIAEFRRTLDVTFGVTLGSGQTYSDCCKELNPEQQRLIHFNIRQLLNYFEGVCVGIKNNVLDEEMCYDHAQFVITRYWLWAQPLAEELRKNNDTLWIELETLSDQWTTREEREKGEQRQRRRLPGRERT